MDAALEIRLLGRFCARRSGMEVPRADFGGRLAQALLRILVVERGRFVSKDRLADALWPGRPPADPDANLRVLVTRARRALGDATLIVTGPAGYWFARDERCTIDAELFLDRVVSGHQALVAGDAGGCLTKLGPALEMWGGEPLAEDAYEDWAQEYRAVLERAHIEALEDAAEASVALRRPCEAVAFAARAVSRDPLRESAHLLLARAQSDAGDTVGALRTLDMWSTRIGDELALSPSQEVTALRDAVLRAHGPATIEPAPRRAGFDFQQLSFVGRDSEMDTILDALRAGRPATVIVRGRAGSGKSRLLTEVSRRLDRPVLSARAVLPEREEAWALTRLIVRDVLSISVDAARELPDRLAHALANLVPELEDLRAIRVSSVDGVSRRVLILEAGVRLVTSIATFDPVIEVDDLHWADATSLTFLALLMRRVPAIGVVIAYRPEDVVRDAPADVFLRGLATSSAPLTRLELRPLTGRHLSGLVADEELAASLAEGTDGSPMAIDEVVRGLARAGLIEPQGEGQWRIHGPGAVDLARELGRAGQRRAVEERVAQQPAARRELLSMLALLGREVPARILSTARAVDQTPVLEDLDTLARATLVRIGDAGWACAHDLVGEIVAASLEPATRARLHQTLARALGEEGADPAEVAHHLAAVGDCCRAADAFALAARRRLQDHAGAEAARLAEEGLSHAQEAATRSALHEIRAEARALTGDLAGARDDLRGALRTRTAGTDRCHLLARLAMLSMGSEGYEKAGELVELALAEAGRDPAARVEALTVAAIVDQARPDRAEARAAEAVELAGETGDAAALASAVDARALATFARGDVRCAAEMFDHVARLYLEAGKLTAVGTPRATRGWLLQLLGRCEEGVADATEALELERTLGQVEGEAIALLIRSQLLADLGRTCEAEEDATRALDIAQALGHREWIAWSLFALALARTRQGGTGAEAVDTMFDEAVAVAEGLPFTYSLINGLVASHHMERGDQCRAERLARQSLAHGNVLSRYEALLVTAELALARGDPGAQGTVAEALTAADAGGYVTSPARRRLALLAGVHPDGR